MDGKLIVASSPHISSPVKTKNIMLDVIIALIPALIASVYYFGPRALVVVCVTVASCVISEYISRKVMKRPQTIGDLSAVVTGILLAFNYPVGLPLWIAAVGGHLSGGVSVDGETPRKMEEQRNGINRIGSGYILLKCRKMNARFIFLRFI